MTREGIAIVFGVALAGCSIGTISPEEFKKEFGISASVSDHPDVNVFSATGMKICLSKLRAAVGEQDVHATAMEVHDKWISLTARRPNERARVDTYECRHGVVAPRVPARLSSLSTLDDDTFAFSEVDFDGLPARLDSAIDTLGLGEVAVITIRKAGALGTRYVSVKLSVTGMHKDGSIEYDAKGNKIASAAPMIASLGTLGTVKLPVEQYVAFDAPAIASRSAFDPDALARGWALDVAHAWKSDALLAQLRAMNPRIDSAGTLASDSCSMRFVSPSCVAAGEGACALSILVGGEGARWVPSRVSVSLTATAGPVLETKGACTLRAALTSIAALDPPFGAVDTADFEDQRTSTWTFTRTATTTPRDLGRYVRIDAVTCGPKR